MEKLMNRFGNVIEPTVTDKSLFCTHVYSTLPNKPSKFGKVREQCNICGFVNERDAQGIVEQANQFVTHGAMMGSMLVGGTMDMGRQNDYQHMFYDPYKNSNEYRNFPNQWDSVQPRYTMNVSEETDMVTGIRTSVHRYSDGTIQKFPVVPVAVYESRPNNDFFSANDRRMMEQYRNVNIMTERIMGIPPSFIRGKNLVDATDGDSKIQY